MIYFIRNVETGHIKIGCAVDPGKRLSVLQTGSVQPLELIGVIEGGVQEERAIHAAFKAHRVRGEWFEPSEELVALAAAATDGSPSARDGSRVADRFCFEIPARIQWPNWLLPHNPTRLGIYDKRLRSVFLDARFCGWITSNVFGVSAIDMIVASGVPRSVMIAAFGTVLMRGDHLVQGCDPASRRLTLDGYQDREIPKIVDAALRFARNKFGLPAPAATLGANADG